MREPMESLNVLPSMWLLTGEIVTELEAIKMLTGATAFQANAGGIGGAEGGSWLVFQGDPGTGLQRAQAGSVDQGRASVYGITS